MQSGFVAAGADQEPEYVESVIDGWRKAGLDITGPKQGTTAPAAAP